MLVELDVTLRAARSSLVLDTKLTNTRTSAVPRFEYWTVTTASLRSFGIAQRWLQAKSESPVPVTFRKAILRLDGKLIAEKDVVAEATKATTIEAHLGGAVIPPGAIFAAEFLQSDRSLLAGQTALP